MTQEIIHDYPPSFAEIATAFGLLGKRGLIFSFGPRIFVPDGGVVPPAILAHEAVHGERQGNNPHDIGLWWRRYIDDVKFRLAEEVPAHQAEYRWWLEHGNRHERRRAARFVAERLSAPLYGRMVGRSAAEAMLRAAV